MTTQVNPIGWFEIAGSDLDKTEAFYSSLFNWTFSASPDFPGYRLAAAGDGIPGAITTAQAGMPRTYAIVSAMVADVAAACEATTKLGGKVLVGPETLNDGLTFANLADPDGNIFGVFSPPAA